MLITHVAIQSVTKTGKWMYDWLKEFCWQLGYLICDKEWQIDDDWLTIT